MNFVSYPTAVNNYSFLFSCQQEASVNIQLTDAKMCHPRNKPQKSDSLKGTYIDFGKICCKSTLINPMYNAGKVMKGDCAQILYKHYFLLNTQNDNKGTNYGQFHVGKSKGVLTQFFISWQTMLL